MKNLKFAMKLYREQRFDDCLRELYKQTFNAKFYVWGLIILSCVLSGISIAISLLTTTDSYVGLAGIALAAAGIALAAAGIALAAAAAAAAAVAGDDWLTKQICKKILKNKS